MAKISVNCPLSNVKKSLQKYLKELSLPQIRFSKHIVKEGEAVFKEAAKAHLEGIIGKNIVSTYQSKRSHDWVKIKTSLRQEVVIGGFTAPRGSRKHFGALLVGVYNKHHELEYAGHVGGGFDATLLQEVHSQLKPLIQQKSPFKNQPQGNEQVTWVNPKLVAKVAFAEWTKDHVMRQPIFKGLRTDKPPKSVKEEIPLKNTQGLYLTNLEKIYWLKEKYTKGDLLRVLRNSSSFYSPSI